MKKTTLDRIKKAFLAAAIAGLFIPSASALLNPSAVYCEALGYEYGIKQTPEGETGICRLPDSSTCDSWDFLKGKCGMDYGYCRKSGYGMKTTTGYETCSAIFTEECAVCVLEDGREVEVTQLMDLDFREGKCPDGACTLGETYANCPEDCPSGSMDLYCDAVEDGVCDPDCSGEEDSDCMKPVCGDDECDYGGGENYGSCPEDCRSGSKDDYCDKSADGLCDPDCPAAEDIDCLSSSAPAALEKCGNSMCESEENPRNCALDCPSGVRDGFCDRLVDGTCDPDCESGDPDCAKTLLDYKGYLMYVSLLICAIVLTAIFHGKVKNT
ncbi:MAG: DUF333 domain-containing protein [Candidatus Altiarchaeota archaeon]|nr:DUF333 domain-containing protein [Candidatus Altiarchaeota archaeon]